MKNVQVFEDRLNCTFDIYAIEDELFGAMFPDETDIEFEDDLVTRLGAKNALSLLDALFANKVDKKSFSGIQGMLFIGDICEYKKEFYPTKRVDDELISVGGKWILSSEKPNQD